MSLTQPTLRAWFILVVAGGLAVSWIVDRARSAGAKEHQLQEVRRVSHLKVAEGKVVQAERVSAGKAASSSHGLSELSRGAALKARDSIVVIKQDVGGIPERLQKPIGDLLTHDDNLERENADLRQLATVDTAVIKNLSEQLGLKTQELELQPKPSRCGGKCGAVIGAAAVLLILGAAK